MKKILFVSSMIFIFGKCAKKPNYSTTPQISFKSFQVLTRDSAILSITFSDGDGDIGGGPSGDGNFFITYYFWNVDSNKYILYKDPTHTFLYDTIDVRSFPSPSDAYKNKPISGEIALLMSPFRPDNSIKKLKMTCYIKDNAGHKSNPVETPDIYAP